MAAESAIHGRLLSSSAAGALSTSRTTALNVANRTLKVTQPQILLHQQNPSTTTSKQVSSSSSRRPCQERTDQHHVDNLSRLRCSTQGGRSLSSLGSNDLCRGLIALRGPVLRLPAQKKHRAVTAMAVAGPLVGPGAGATLWAVLAAAAAAGQVCFPSPLTI